MAKAKPTLNYEPLIPLVHKNITKLNAMGWQNVAPEHINQLAVNQAKALAFLETTEADLRDQSPLEYQGTMDCALAMLEEMDDGRKLQFLDAVGRPLSNDEMVRWFFGL